MPKFPKFPKVPKAEPPKPPKIVERYPDGTPIPENLTAGDKARLAVGAVAGAVLPPAGAYGVYKGLEAVTSPSEPSEAAEPKGKPSGSLATGARPPQPRQPSGVAQEEAQAEGASAGEPLGEPLPMLDREAREAAYYSGAYTSGSADSTAGAAFVVGRVVKA